jgi:hypothetical protein
MASTPVNYQDLIDARETLISEIEKGLTSEERRFLLSLKEDNPEWKLLGLAGIEELPTINGNS